MQAVILSERTLGDTDGLFAAGVAHIARKLGRVKPLDADALPPDRAGTLRALQARGVRIGCWSAGPEEAARIVVHHLGLSRRVEAIAAGGGDAAAQLAADLGAPAAETVVVT